VTIKFRRRISERFSSDFLILSGGRLVQVAHALFSVRLVSELLGATEIGRINLILSAAFLPSFVFVSPVSNFLASQSIKWHRNRSLHSVVKTFYFYLVTVAIVCGFLFFYIKLRGLSSAANDNQLIIAVVIGGYIIGNNGLNALATVLNTLGDRISFVLVTNAAAWGGLCVAYYISARSHFNAETWLSGLVIAQIIVSVAALLRVNNIQKRFLGDGKESLDDKFTLQRALAFSWPLALATGLYWVNLSGYRFILGYATDMRTIGLLVTGLSLAIAPLSILDTLFTEFYRPIFYRQVVAGDQIETTIAFNRYAALYFPSIIIVSVVCGATGQFAARLLVSDDFFGVSWLSGWGAVIQSGYMIYGVCVSLIFTLRCTSRLILPNLMGAIVTCIGVYVAGRSASLGGVGASLGLGVLVTSAATWISLFRIIPIKIPWKSMGIAATLSTPILTLLLFLIDGKTTPTILYSIMILALSYAYAFIIVWYLNRRALAERKVIERTEQNNKI